MWARLLNTALGIWLMAAPTVLGYTGKAAEVSDRIAGPLALTCAFVAIWEATRALRRVNLAIGVWLLVAPFVLGYTTTPLVNSLLVGAALAALSFVRGPQKHRFGGGWAMLWNKERPQTASG